MTTYDFGAYTLDTEDSELYCAGQRVALARTTFKVLVHLIAQRGRPVSRQALIETAWPGRTVSGHSLDIAIAEARMAIGDKDRARHEQIIQTEWTRGYKFVAPVEILPAAESGAHDSAPGPRAAHDVHGTYPDIADFLERLGQQALLLEQNILYRPDYWPGDLWDCFIPTRVLDEQAHQEVLAAGQEACGPTAAGRPAALVWHQENLLRSGASAPYRPRLLRDVWRERKQHVVLQGQPGEGKSTALWLLVAERCREYVQGLREGSLGSDSSDLRVPLALRLGSVPPPGKAGTLLDEAGDTTLEVAYGTGVKPDVVRTWLAAKIERREFELFLDALDELVTVDGEVLGGRGRKSRRVWLQEQLLGCNDVPVLLTTRETTGRGHGGMLHQPQLVWMVPFGRREVRQYVERYFGVPGQKQLREELLSWLRASSHARELVQLPLLLAILCHRKGRYPQAPLPTTQTELLWLGLHGLLERGDEKRGHTRKRTGRDNTKEVILGSVAWRFHAAEPLPIAAQGVREMIHLEDWFAQDRPASVEALLDEYVEDGLLVPNGPDQFRFVLRSFHEYCLAGFIMLALRGLLQAGNPGAVERLIRGGAPEWGREGEPGWDGLKPLFADSWSNVWPLVCRLLDDAAGCMLRCLEGYELNQTWARCVSESLVGVPERDEIIENTIRWLHNPGASEESRQVCARFLGEIGGEVARQALLGGLEEPETPKNVRWLCALALGKIGDEPSRHALMRFLVEPEPQQDLDIVLACAEALGFQTVLDGDRLTDDEPVLQALSRRFEVVAPTENDDPHTGSYRYGQQPRIPASPLTEDEAGEIVMVAAVIRKKHGIEWRW